MKHLLLDFPEFDNQLNDELYHSARLRSLVLSCIFFTVAFGFWINIRLGNLPNRFYISIGIWNQYQWQLILQSVCGTIELLFFFILKKKIIQDNNKLQWFMHVLGFTEISVISVAIWIHVLVEEPLVGLNAPPLMLYGIFILSLALFLEARHCISAGFIAAIQYAWIINSVHKM
ncbi:MAG TPA: hypothetical protein PKK94_06155, partial [Leptospiraceae bacterium]|nr:hypothetical protein [Leptospiraceae bacterium]